jgi:hypothetical protein
MTFYLFMCRSEVPYMQKCASVNKCILKLIIDRMNLRQEIRQIYLPEAKHAFEYNLCSFFMKC